MSPGFVVLVFSELAPLPYSSNMALDADTVLWALRGLHDPQDCGVRAHDLARFMSKDATLSEDFSGDDVTAVLESLVAEGTLTHASTTVTDESDENASNPDTTLYRFPSGIESLVPDADSSEQDGWDDLLGLGADQPRNFLLEALAEDAAVGVDLKASAAADAAEIASLRVRVDELEGERDSLLAERNTWRRRAELADKEVARLRGDGDELRTRVLEFETLLGRERVLAAERRETARRAAAGLARALEELERVEPSAPDSRPQAPATRHRKMPRGNWLQ
jgi:hypothetical protein